MTDKDDPYKARRGLTFAQAEGADPMPRQLALGELSQALRIKLHMILLSSLRFSKTSDHRHRDVIGENWSRILFDLHTDIFLEYADTYSRLFNDQTTRLGDIIKNRPYVEVLGLFQFILTHRACPNHLATSVNEALVTTQAAYRVVDGGLIAPMASEEEGQAVARAFADLAGTDFGGARTHLGNAAKALNAGSWAASVRESISAVEAVVRLLDPQSGDLKAALRALGAAGHMHPALRDGLSKLYGYTSDEKGIRHFLLEDGDAKVDETDALYMFGACASFITYVIGKARTGGLIA